MDPRQMVPVPIMIQSANQMQAVEPPWYALPMSPMSSMHYPVKRTLFEQPPMAANAQDAQLQVVLVEDKDFPNSADLFSEIYTVNPGRGETLIHSAEAISNGSSVTLKGYQGELRVRIRQRFVHNPAQWHVLIALSQIRKSLETAPFEWDGWLGVFPSSFSLEAQGPEVMFTHAVHLISKSEGPKIRIRLVYRDRTLQAQRGKEEREQQEANEEAVTAYGQHSFKELQTLLNSRPSRKAGLQGAARQEDRSRAKVLDLERNEATAKEALQAAITCLMKVQETLDVFEHGQKGAAPKLPSVEEILASSSPGRLLERYLQHLQGRLKGHLAGPFTEADVAEVLRSALAGALDQVTGPPSTDPNAVQTRTMKAKWRSVWNQLTEVSKIVQEKERLMPPAHHHRQARTDDFQTLMGEPQLRRATSGDEVQRIRALEGLSTAPPAPNRLRVATLAPATSSVHIRDMRSAYLG